MNRHRYNQPYIREEDIIKSKPLTVLPPMTSPKAEVMSVKAEVGVGVKNSHLVSDLLSVLYVCMKAPSLLKHSL